jgi:hypothetical protein
MRKVLERCGRVEHVIQPASDPPTWAGSLHTRTAGRKGRRPMPGLPALDTPSTHRTADVRVPCSTMKRFPPTSVWSERHKMIVAACEAAQREGANLMALPSTEADLRRLCEAISETPTTEWYKPTRMLPDPPPTLRAWPYRLWCALRGHGGITPFPSVTYYRGEGLCKRCGARVCS